MFRDKGKQIIRTVLKREQNVITLENIIFDKHPHSQQDYFTAVYEAVGFLIRTPMSKDTIVECIRLQQTNKIGFDDVEFDESRRRIDEIDQFATHPFEIEEGISECSCGSKRTITFQKQTRAADEGATTFSHCVECGKKWRHNN